MWPNRRLLELLNIELPIVQAPMAGAQDADIMIGAASVGALPSLPCAMLSVEKIREQVGVVRQRLNTPINLNFFCHTAVDADPQREAGWKQRLAAYYHEYGVDPAAPLAAANRAPFDAAMCALVEELRPEVVSFHFGLPAPALLDRVKATGAKVIASATIVREAIWLEERGVDAIIAQGAEAGGHRGMFLTQSIAEQPGLFALLPQLVDAVHVPVIAAGGIADGRGIAAAFALGAAGVQIGTAFLRCPESKLSALARAALGRAGDDSTVITNVMTGRPARGIVNRLMREIGPVSPDAPSFPHAATALAPLKAAAEQQGKVDFTNLWAGQAARLGHDLPAAELTRALAGAALLRLSQLAGHASPVAAQNPALL
ncbi:nitronate monooxygenase [Rhodopseudomonas rhenobacensis]|uniref:Nitronate monooxygenase n=1 Tax=Rhodopseudomonas rhenobacensis TaxID=87461 RepID=A0A7W7Z1W3_9BRAD|nr:nitronate monooxygenase family protein [Rhodopseudomonas rhenobacensis]MBB5046510.1 nitronate monooxygenase [Rhodopseudomonas rhenobacensis]